MKLTIIIEDTLKRPVCYWDLSHNGTLDNVDSTIAGAMLKQIHDMVLKPMEKAGVPVKQIRLGQ